MMNPTPASDASAQPGNLLSQAQQWLSQVPTSPKNTGTKTAGTFNKLSTTQKVLGGTLLAVGAAYLVRSKKSGSTDAQADTLQELLHFVNDRIAGYERAVAESEDPQLRGYYKQLVSQSQQFATYLNTCLTQAGGSRETATTLKGKLYRTWMDVRAALTGRDEQTILGSNIYGEEWALKAYEEALASQTLRGTVRQAVERQYAISQATYQRLKNLEDKQ
jgi:uncharacterized protein (TIGR02284 family)